ncbi:MAG: DUF2062 domain-containing protein [Chitinispirillaceae bacterium]|nr:DUF2062 domain-containing protein [Chitinispirillaceae bacterium]
MNFGVRSLWEKTVKVLSNELKANTSPFRVSLSLAVGVLVGLSPFYGIHTIIVLALAFTLQLNRPLALIASGITLPPLVPFWIAGGIFIGKLVVPVEAAGRIVDMAIKVMATERFWGAAAGAMEFCRRFFPRFFFEHVDEGAPHGIIDGFVQWFIGCSVFAVAGAALTFAVCYCLLLRRDAERRRRTL